MTLPPLPRLSDPAPANMDDVVRELRGLRGDVRDLGDRVMSAESRATSAFDKAAQAYERSNEAMRSVDEVKLNAAATQSAMMRHAEQVTQASQQIVKANAEQTPLLRSMVTILDAAKKNQAAILAFAGLLGAALAEAVRAFHSFLGH